MQYRWGFIGNDVFVECSPIVDDDTALDYTQESGQIFYRAKINGSLAFRFEFDAILAKGYNYTHIIVLQWYDNSDDTWKEMWRGQFTLTDCEIDYDTNTISVQPTTLDRYTAILDALESEYNLTKLSAPMMPVDILIRPCLQLYALNGDKLSNYIGNNYWESNCESRDFLSLGRFTLLKDSLAILIKWGSGDLAGKEVLYIGSMFDNYLYGKVYSGNDWVEDSIWLYQIRHDQENNTTTFDLRRNNIHQCDVTFEFMGAGLPPVDYWINPSGNVEDVSADWIQLCARFKVQSDLDDVTINNHQYPLYPIPDDDIEERNNNYNRLMWSGVAHPYYSDETSEDVTEWGMAYNGRYFVKPADTPTRHYIPVAQSQWNYQSVWYYVDQDAYGTSYNDVEAALKAQQTIRDSYPLRETIVKLMQKAGWQGDYFISGILGGSQDYAGFRFLPVITPKSNVISSYYDSPAQNAPISLGMIFSMLKQAYKIYWYIDENNNIHLEHISFFDNGYQYTEDEPVILVDLTSKTHTRTYESKVFGQNKVKYDKQDMPQQYTFGWMDTQSIPFTGYPIKSDDVYVQKGSKDEINIGSFDTDIDFILANPNEVSKDGFVLFALPAVNNTYPHTTRIEALRITNEAGETSTIMVQNAEGAFAKIHENMWRYSLPCENVTINNLPTTAITTGRYKLQSIEFADESMADILREISNCNMAIRTQQGDGYIKTLSINLNSLAAKADLLFNFVGRWYYLRGTALGSSITINVNGESVTIDVSSNVFKYRYNTPISALTFNAADVVSVNFADCDSLDELTSTADMFKNCTELLAVDFGNKRLGAVTDAEDMFKGCTELTTLICPSTESWKADLDFTDCPLLTTESIYSLIGYLFSYESGTHTITFNQTMWNALDSDVQTDIETKANAKGWQIGMAAAYFISGTSSASVVYATINGDAVEIDVEGGLFNYGYRSPITSISFEADTNATTIDFSLSDGLAGLTSLDNAFKGCSSLVSVNFTNCNISNVVSASDCFANCAALANLTIPTETWKSDVDFSSCSLITYAEMQDIIGGLYTYTSGVHTITFNSTYWDSLSVAQQRTISDAADAKGWATNAVVVVYYIRGKSTNVNGTETFNIQFIDDGALSPSAAETITCAVDGDGNFEHQYSGKKIYSMNNTFVGNNTITEIEFTEDFEAASSLVGTFAQMIGNVSLPNAIISNAVCSYMFYENKSNTISAPNATFNGNVSAYRMFNKCECEIISLPSATFANVTNTEQMFYQSKIKEINLPLATFTNTTTCLQMFSASTLLTIISLPIATFTNATTCGNMFEGLSSLTALTLPNATFASATNITGIFANMSNCLTINIPNATFASATNINYFAYQSAKITTIDATSATFANVTTTTAAFQTMNSLTNIVLGEQNVAISNSATSANIDLRYSPLSYQSMVNVANIVNDRTNLSALTITFKTSAWSALSSAEQTNIDTILNGKNWNRAIA